MKSRQSAARRRPCEQPGTSSADVVESPESNQREHLVHRVVGSLGVVAARLNGDGALAVHGCGVEQHVEVVVGVDGEPLTEFGLLIRVPGLKVCSDGITPAPHFVERVRRHVVDMTRPRNRAAEEAGARFGLVGANR